MPRQLAAVRAFMQLPEAESLAAANKRVVNILRQAAAKGESFANVQRSELSEPAEIALFDALVGGVEDGQAALRARRLRRATSRASRC